MSESFKIDDFHIFFVIGALAQQATQWCWLHILQLFLFQIAFLKIDI